MVTSGSNNKAYLRSDGFCLLLSHLDAWLSLCRIMYVQTGGIHPDIHLWDFCFLTSVFKVNGILFVVCWKLTFKKNSTATFFQNGVSVIKGNPQKHTVKGFQRDSSFSSSENCWLWGLQIIPRNRDIDFGKKSEKTGIFLLIVFQCCEHCKLHSAYLHFY